MPAVTKRARLERGSLRHRRHRLFWWVVSSTSFDACYTRMGTALVVCLVGAVLFGAQSPQPVQYRFTILEPQHRWMQVDASFPDLPDNVPLELHVSRSSPGRYANHDFAKNVYDVHAFGTDGRELMVTHTDPSRWT